MSYRYLNVGQKLTRHTDVGSDDQSAWSWFNEQQNIDLGYKKDDARFGPADAAEDFQYIDIQSDFWNEGRLSADQLDQYETWYIDDTYGTTNRRHSGRDVYASDLELEYEGYDIRAHWGIDLVRVAYDQAQPDTPDRRHYEWLTRGEVDWAYYQNSEVYKNAWISHFTKDGDYHTQSGDHKWDAGDWDQLWTHQRSTDVDKVSYIREVNRMMSEGTLDEEGVGEGDDDFWTEWDNMYTSTYLHQSDVGTTIQVPGIDGPVDVEVTQDMVGTARDPSTAYTYEPTALFQASSMESRVTAKLNA